MKNRSNGAPLAKLIAVLFVIFSGAIAISAIVDSAPAPAVPPESADSDSSVPEIDGDRFPYQIQISQPPNAIAVGEEMLMVAETVPYQPQEQIFWSSDDPSILKIELGGLATGVSPGEATLVACVVGGPSVELLVTVTEAGGMNVDDSGSIRYPGIPAGNRDLPIANSSHNLGPDYVPDLVAVNEIVPVFHKDLQLTQEALDAYILMYNDFKAAGKGEVKMLSAYRSYQRQGELLDNKTAYYVGKGYSQADARALALTSIQAPGASEHQLGVSIDVSTDGNTQHNFRDLPQGKWITENCNKYGFVIRYTKDKEPITGIIAEPWHLRYVGVDHAKFMTDHSLCLEEYILL
ncbi:MAG: D-alanyl-D-alanine carboxypeptidase family protein [Oscillospiraceae bacterium]|nr:D-alanyl-D-alanine carboxypeptidase family protein [Oscillospiraceae bacterium]